MVRRSLSRAAVLLLGLLRAPDEVSEWCDTIYRPDHRECPKRPVFWRQPTTIICMIVYHQADSHLVPLILRQGLQLVQGEGKGDDPAIAQTDEYLDARRPEYIRQAGVNRRQNIYAYLGDERHVIRITDGAEVTLGRFITESWQVVLRLTPPLEHCYISDLDAFDKLKRALQEETCQSECGRLAADYWRRVTPAVLYVDGSIARPEVLVTRPIPPEHIARVN